MSLEHEHHLPSTPHEPSPEQEALLPIVEKYMDAMKALPNTGNWKIESTTTPVNSSWNVATTITTAEGKPVGTVSVSFSPKTFYLGWIGIEKEFRDQKISSLIYAHIASFLEHERPGYGFSSSAVAGATRHLSEKYFDILSTRKNKFRGRVRSPSQ